MVRKIKGVYEYNVGKEQKLLRKILAYNLHRIKSSGKMQGMKLRS